MKARRESSEDIGYDPFNLNSNQSDQEKWSTSKSGPVFFLTFPVGLHRSIEFWTEISKNFGSTDRAHILPAPSPIIFCFNLGSAFAVLELLGWARFRRRSFHEPSLIHWIINLKYMKSSSESIKEHLFQFGTAQQFFTPSPTRNFDCGTTLERFWCRRRTFLVPNLMHKL